MTYRKGDHYARKGIVTPSIRRGANLYRSYSFYDVLALRLVRELRSAGLSLRQARRVLAILRQHGEPEEWPSTLRLITNGRAARLVLGKEENIVDAVLSLPGQQGWYTTFDVPMMVREAREAFDRAVQAAQRGRRTRVASRARPGKR